MFRNKKWMILSLTSVVAAGIFMTGCKKDYTPAEKSEWLVEKVTDELDLTKQQSDHLQKIVTGIITQSPETKSVKREMFDEVYNQVKSDKVDADKLNEIFLKNEKHYAGMIPQITAGFSEFYATLNPEQKAKLVSRLEKLKKKSDR